MKSFASCLFILFFILGTAIPKASSQKIFGVHLDITQPIGEYANNVYSTPMGLSFNMLVPIKKVKGLYLGGEIGVGMLYKETYDLMRTDGSGSAEVEEEDCYLMYHLDARYFVHNKSIFTPYGEAKIGATSFFSSVTTEEAEALNIDSETKFHGTAFNAGIGAGFLTRISSNLSLDTNVLVNKGSRTNFRSIDDTTDKVKLSFDEGRRVSATNFVNFKVGILFGF